MTPPFPPCACGVSARCLHGLDGRANAGRIEFIGCLVSEPEAMGRAARQAHELGELRVTCGVLHDLADLEQQVVGRGDVDRLALPAVGPGDLELAALVPQQAVERDRRIRQHLASEREHLVLPGFGREVRQLRDLGLRGEPAPEHDQRPDGVKQGPEAGLLPELPVLEELGPLLVRRADQDHAIHHLRECDREALRHDATDRVADYVEPGRKLIFFDRFLHCGQDLDELEPERDPALGIPPRRVMRLMVPPLEEQDLVVRLEHVVAREPVCCPIPLVAPLEHEDGAPRRAALLQDVNLPVHRFGQLPPRQEEDDRNDDGEISDNEQRNH